MWLDIHVLYQLSLIQFKTHKLSNRHVLTLQIFLQHNSNTMWSEQTVAWYTSSGASAILLTPHLKHTQTIKHNEDTLKLQYTTLAHQKTKTNLILETVTFAPNTFLLMVTSVSEICDRPVAHQQIGHTPITTGRHLHHWATEICERPVAHQERLATHQSPQAGTYTTGLLYTIGNE